MDEGLNLNTDNLANAAKGASHVFSLLSDGVFPAVAILLFGLLVFLSVAWAARRRSETVPTSLLISSWPVGLRVCLWPLLTGFAFTHALSAVSVYYNTNIANPTTVAYFEAMGVGRLSSLSHAHLFAHAMMYFTMAALVQFTRAGRLTTLFAPVAALWAGVFDVLSWWGLKRVSPNFEILSAICGTLFSLAFLVMAYAIAKESFAQARGKS